MTKDSLAITHPELITQWDATKNFPLTPFDITAGSNKKVWWKCEVADDHEWIAVIASRTRGAGCPCCSGHKVIPSNCLANTYPEIAKQWHPTKNLHLTPFNVTYGSNKKVWWKCDVADDHEWESNICNRTLQNTKCPCCAGQKAVLSNCLATTHPQIIKQWHPTKNLLLTPFDVTAGSNKKVWWKCNVADDHEWQSIIANKTREECQLGCPCCSGHKLVLSTCLATTHPDLIKQWHATKNFSLTPFDISCGSMKNVWWKCILNDTHEWSAAPNSLIRIRSIGGNGCPLCWESRGEKKIKNILSELNIYYITEKSFDGCKDKYKLSFDFYLPDDNALIEYDGIQHFEPIKFFGGINGLQSNQKRDEIKNEFAAKNNIPLLRIPYTKFDSIEEEIKSFIKSFKS